MLRAVDHAWRARIVARFGPGVQPWIDALPARVAELARTWRLDLGEPFASGATSRVLRCRRADGTAAVLKVSPDPGLIAAEAAALRAWATGGAVPRVLAVADDALLLGRVEPGERLVERARPASVEEVAALVAGLHRPPPAQHAFPPLAERLRFVYDLVARRGADAERVERSRAAALELAGDGAVAPVLVHGDLHAGNVLDGGERGLVAIDPRACVGDLGFDLVDWVLHDGEPRDRVAALAAATGYDPDRLAAWTRAALVLAGPTTREGRPEAPLERRRRTAEAAS